MSDNGFQHKITVVCPLCGEEQIITMNDEEYERYRVGILENNECVQNVFPEWPADKRELLISGICDNCWQISVFEVED